MLTAESEARKALHRLRRAAEKAERELLTLEGALRLAEGDDFPAREYDDALEAARRITSFVDEEGVRLREKILNSGGLEPGRVRRSP